MSTGMRQTRLRHRRGLRGLSEPAAGIGHAHRCRSGRRPGVVPRLRSLGVGRRRVRWAGFALFNVVQPLGREQLGLSQRAARDGDGDLPSAARGLTLALGAPRSLAHQGTGGSSDARAGSGAAALFAPRRQATRAAPAAGEADDAGRHAQEARWESSAASASLRASARHSSVAPSCHREARAALAAALEPTPPPQSFSFAAETSLPSALTTPATTRSSRRDRRVARASLAGLTRTSSGVLLVVRGSAERVASVPRSRPLSSRRGDLASSAARSGPGLTFRMAADRSRPCDGSGAAAVPGDPPKFNYRSSIVRTQLTLELRVAPLLGVRGGGLEPSRVQRGSQGWALGGETTNRLRNRARVIARDEEAVLLMTEGTRPIRRFPSRSPARRMLSPRVARGPRAPPSAPERSARSGAPYTLESWARGRPSRKRTRPSMPWLSRRRRSSSAHSPSTGPTISSVCSRESRPAPDRDTTPSTRATRPTRTPAGQRTRRGAHGGRAERRRSRASDLRVRQGGAPCSTTVLRRWSETKLETRSALDRSTDVGTPNAWAARPRGPRLAARETRGAGTVDVKTPTTSIGPTPSLSPGPRRGGWTE